MADHCVICEHQLSPEEERDGRHACRSCSWNIQSALRELPRQLPILQACVHKDATPRVGRIGGTGLAHAPLPLREDTIDLIGPGGTLPASPPPDDQTGGLPINAIVIGWAHHLAQDGGWHVTRHPVDGHPIIERWASPGPGHLVEHRTETRPGEQQRLASWCAWLIAYLPHAVTRPWVRELHNDLEHLVRRVRAITSLIPQRHHKDAPCPGCGSFSLVSVDDQYEITCTQCPQLLTPEEYTAHRRDVLARLSRIALLLAATQTQESHGVA